MRYRVFGRNRFADGDQDMSTRAPQKRTQDGNERSAGIRAKLRIGDLQSCPIAQVSKDGVECYNVSKRVEPESGRVTEEFATGMLSNATPYHRSDY